MNNFFKLSLFFLFPVLANAQDIVGGGGECKTDGNPNTKTALNNQLKNECWLATDTVTGLAYRYEPQGTPGTDRWVLIADNASIPAKLNPTAGTGITITGTYPNLTWTNSAPDQTVSLTGAGISVITGTYPNFTITSTEVDGLVTNEGSLTVVAGGANDSQIQSNTSGSTNVTIAGTAPIAVTESGSTITVAMQALVAYDSDAAAITGGLASGQWYKLSVSNIYGLPANMPKLVD